MSLASAERSEAAGHTAVVILNYNGAALLQRFLPIVLEHSGGATIVVADNASSDNSIQILRTHFPSVTIVQLDQNYGYCGGYNRALRQVEADYYVLLNSDIEVTPGWLDPLIQLLSRDASVAAVQPKILSYHHRKNFEHAGAAGGFIDSLGYPFWRGRVFDHVEEDRGQYDDTRQIFWASGACLFIRAAVFHHFHGFDEDYFAHMEEIDLCWKLQRAGYKVYYTSQSVIYHVGAGTLSYGHPRKIFLNFRNGLLVIFKHLAMSELVYKLPARFFLDWVAGLRFFLRGEWKNSAAIFRAHASFIINITRELRKRKALLKAYPTYSHNCVKRGSIVFDFFVLGKKIYSDQ